MGYIGKGPSQVFRTFSVKDSFTGDGSTTVFTLSRAAYVGSPNDVQVFVDNVRQEPGVGKSYTIGLDGSSNATQLTFSSAPPNTSEIYVIIAAEPTSVLVPAAGTITSEMIADGTVVAADIDDGTVTNAKLTNSSITVSGDSGSDGVSLGETLTVSGTSNEIETAVTSNTLTIGLPNDVTIAGNLTVNGTTTTISTTNTTISDNLLELNSGVASNANDSGIIIERGSTGDNAIIAWDESADEFILGTTTATASDTGDLTITAGDVNVGAITATGLTTTGDINFGDNDKAVFGAGSDLQIYHDGSNSIIKEAGTGDLRISATNMYITNGADNEAKAYFGDNGPVELYYDNSKKFETTSTGATLTGDLLVTEGSPTITFTDTDSNGSAKLFCDGGSGSGNLYLDADTNNALANSELHLRVDGTDKVVIDSSGHLKMNDSQKIRLGNSQDLELFHDGSNSYLQDVGTGELYIRGSSSVHIYNVTDTEPMAVFNKNSSVDLYYDNSKKFETTTNGITVTGQVLATGATAFAGDDNSKIKLGNSGDLEIYHDGSNSFIKDTGTGNLYIDATQFRVRSATGQDFIAADHNGNVILHYQGANKFETNSTGAKVSGSLLQTEGSTGADATVQARAATVYTNLKADDVSGFNSIDYSHNLRFRYGTDDQARFDNQGSFQIAGDGGFLSTPHSQNSDGGVKIYGDGSGNTVEGLGSFARNQNTPLIVNRVGNDGSILDFVGQGTTEGYINISGATVSLVGFTGTHWSRLSDNSKPTILKGTILESLDEMMDWYQITFNARNEEDTKDIEYKFSYVLQEGQSVGDVITYNFEGKDYQATIIQEEDVKHSKCKISDTSESKAVYGVFNDWDNDSEDGVNDILVAQTGTFVVRINGNETVSKGDLIQSNGDGTGKVQADDLLRASTVAKVLSTNKIETYDDGSYIVPCSLHC